MNASPGKKIIATIIASAFCLTIAWAQHVDTVIRTGIYKSYYSYSVKAPLYVTYTLYKGGGGCDRDEQGFSFRKCGVQTATDADFTNTGYDKGHLANAEDFADDCDNEEKTFCYYNCVAQTVKLNRGIWKTWEEKVRVLSQTKKLFVIAGAIYGDKTIGDHVGVPSYCYKIVLENKTKKLVYCVLFPNDNSKQATRISLYKLKKKLGYDLVP